MRITRSIVAAAIVTVSAWTVGCGAGGRTTSEQPAETREAPGANEEEAAPDDTPEGTAGTNGQTAEDSPARAPAAPRSWATRWPFDVPCPTAPGDALFCEGSSVVGFFHDAYLFQHVQHEPMLFERFETSARRPGIAAVWKGGVLWLTSRTCNTCAALTGWSFVGMPSRLDDADLGELQQRLGLPPSPLLRTRQAWEEALAQATVIGPDPD